MFNCDQWDSKEAIITDEGRVVAYSELNSIIEHICNRVEKSNIAFCLCENSVGAIAGYLAFLTVNEPVVLLDSHKTADVIASLVNLYQPRYIWTPQYRKNEFQGDILIQLEDYVLIKRSVDEYEVDPDLALLLTTSGSTGSPKLVKLTNLNLFSNALSIAEYLQINENERPITSLPMYYSYGLSVINSHLLKGATLLVTNKTVLEPQFWTFVRRAKATSIAGVPYTYEMLRRLRIFRMDLPFLKTMTQAGGKMNSKLVREYIESARTGGKRFIVMYGQTEATARMSYLPEDRALEKYASIGIAIPGGKFSLIDTNGQVITADDVDGELVYEGDNVSMGYAENPSDLAKGDENHGVLRTGDVARRDIDGFYYITGRLKRFVKVWGNRCNLDAVEQIVKTEVTMNCASSGVDDLITIFVTNAGLEERIKEVLSEKTGLNIRAFAVKVIDVIPKNDSGKIQYAELLKLL